MRCINMKIIDVLLLSINLVAIKSQVISPKEHTSQLAGNGNFNKFERDCPGFWKVIQNNSLTEMISCSEKTSTNKTITEEDVLQFACFLAKKMMVFICDNKYTIPSDYFKFPERDPICPFVFTQLIKLGNLSKELTNENHCNKVCSDLYEVRPQCVILTKLNNYLKSIEIQIHRVGLIKPSAKKSEINSVVSKAHITDNKVTEQKTIKETTFKTNTEGISNKTTTSSNKFQSDESIKPETEKPEPKSKLHDFSMKIGSEKPNNEKPMDTVPNIAENSEVRKTELEIPEEDSKILSIKIDKPINEEDSLENDGLEDKNELQETQRKFWEEHSGKAQMAFNQKEINPSDGFLQAEDSHFFFYFVAVSSVIVIAYIGFHYKNKILAYALEGTSGRRSRRRPNPARYRKLETNLEEAISSNASETVTSSIVY